MGIKEEKKANKEEKRLPFICRAASGFILCHPAGSGLRGRTAARPHRGVLGTGMAEREEEKERKRRARRARGCSAGHGGGTGSGFRAAGTGSTVTPQGWLRAFRLCFPPPALPGSVPLTQAGHHPKPIVLSVCCWVSPARPCCTQCTGHQRYLRSAFLSIASRRCSPGCPKARDVDYWCSPTSPS